jgi:glycogen synthase
MNTVRFALECWKNQEGWKVLQRNGMEKDFSWERQGEEYIALYRRLMPPRASVSMPRASTTLTPTASTRKTPAKGA